MDEGKILIVNLSKGNIGEDNARLLGSLLVTRFQQDAMSRSNVPEEERADFYRGLFIMLLSLASHNRNLPQFDAVDKFFIDF